MNIHRTCASLARHSSTDHLHKSRFDSSFVCFFNTIRTTVVIFAINKALEEEKVSGNRIFAVHQYWKKKYKSVNSMWRKMYSLRRFLEIKKLQNYYKISVETFDKFFNTRKSLKSHIEGDTVPAVDILSIITLVMGNNILILITILFYFYLNVYLIFWPDLSILATFMNIVMVIAWSVRSMCRFKDMLRLKDNKRLFTALFSFFLRYLYIN